MQTGRGTTEEATAPWSSESNVDDTWLGRRVEEVLDPDLRIVDPHHHLWDHAHHRYMMPELLRDLTDGHRVETTVYIEASSHYETTGPDELRPVGETRFVAGLADEPREPDAPAACAAIVAFAQLRLGSRASAVIEAHLEAGRGRVRGIRNVSTWDPTPELQSRRSKPLPELLRDTRFREGFAVLGRYDLVFDSWLYHTQLDELIELADAFPDTPIVIDHLGGPIGTAQYASNRAEVFTHWASRFGELAKRPRTYIKIGGLGMPWAGFDFRSRPLPPTSEELAVAWRPFIESAIAAFGPDRCMFESNFPVDNEVCTYRTLWNAFKHVTATCSSSEKISLFAGTASKVYGLGEHRP